MITRIRDIKGAFIAFCARDKGLPMDRTAFQDFEIAYFLNTAYDKCVKKRVDALSEAMHNIGTGRTFPSRDHKMGNILSELGSLYTPQPQAMEFLPAMMINDQRFKMWGSNTRMFEIMPVNGAIPYVIGADLHEVHKEDVAKAAAILKTKYDERYRGQKSWDKKWKASNRDMSDYFHQLGLDNVSWPIRILSGPEMMEYSLLLQTNVRNIERLPYRVGRIRTFMAESQSKVTDSVMEALKKAVRNVLQKEKVDYGDKMIEDMTTKYFRHESFVILELLHGMYFNKDDYELFVSFETVKHPAMITETAIHGESVEVIEANFGFEIAETAADMAMKVLSAGGMKPQPAI